MYNKVILIGRLCADPEFLQTQSGTPVCRIRLAVNRRFADKQTGQRQADFIGCTAFGKTAEFLSRYFHKGSAVLIDGELRNDDYTDREGMKHYRMQVAVNQAAFTGERQGSSGNAEASYGGSAYGGNSYGSNSSKEEPSAAAQLGDLGDFEEILSDGDVPF